MKCFFHLFQDVGAEFPCRHRYGEFKALPDKTHVGTARELRFLDAGVGKHLERESQPVAVVLDVLCSLGALAAVVQFDAPALMYMPPVPW